MQVESNEEKAASIEKQIEAEKAQLKKVDEEKAKTMKEYAAQQQLVKDAEHQKKVTAESLKKLEDGIE